MHILVRQVKSLPMHGDVCGLKKLNIKELISATAGGWDRCSLFTCLITLTYEGCIFISSVFSSRSTMKWNLKFGGLFGNDSLGWIFVLFKVSLLGAIIGTIETLPGVNFCWNFTWTGFTRNDSFLRVTEKVPVTSRVLA